VDQAQAWFDSMWATLSTQRTATWPMATAHELAALASQPRHVLIDFDGPLCDIFSGLPNCVVADELRGELRAAGITMPEDVDRIADPLEVFRAVADLGDQAATFAQELLTGLEVRAARVARPAPGSAELITTAARTGRSVTVVTNNSRAAAGVYLS
jgi:phosphoglycolate phosphatase